MSFIKIGTSGYSYKDWADGIFYPEGLPQKEWLEFYCKHFDTVELNVTFYRLLKEKTFSNWYERTSSKFHFVIKGSRFITHIRKLKNCEEPLELLFSRARNLKDKLRVVFWQMPASQKKNLERLGNFCEILRKVFTPNIKHTFEFRDDGWFSEDVYQLLRKYNIALCVADSPEWPSVKEITADFIYLRFHGGKKLYGSQYSKQELESWAKDIEGWHKQKKDVYAFFNNDMQGYAIKNARQLKEILRIKTIF